MEYISPSWERLTGYTRKEYINDPDLVKRSIHPEDQEIFENMLQKPGVDRTYVFRAFRKDQSCTWLEVCTIPVYRDCGDLVAVEYAIHEIDAWKQTEEALIEANKKLSLMNSIVRHDILNQATVVLGNIALLQDRQLDPEIASALGKLRTAAEIIQSQIEFTRNYQDLGAYSPRWFFVDSLVTSAVRAIRPGVIDITTDLDGISIYADPLISSVFYNLLENTIRHGEGATRVRVTAVLEREGAMIIWEDDGVGVPDEIKDRIFERGVGSHTGLGLFLIRKILSITGIAIRETGIPGEGARFEMSVPSDCIRIR